VAVLSGSTQIIPDVKRRLKHHTAPTLDRRATETKPQLGQSVNLAKLEGLGSISIYPPSRSDSRRPVETSPTIQPLPMNRNELQPQVEQESTLSEIGTFLRVQRGNAHFASLSQNTGEAVNGLEQVLADFNKQDYKRTIEVLERFENLFRIRADEETDPEGVPSYDNATANKIQAWIAFLSELPATGH